MSGISIAGLQATPLGPNYGFNWVFLVEVLVCGILALFFLFYFNRLFATVVSYIIRAWTWHRYRAYIDITALQISLLGGRIFFKSIRYHAHNITLLVHDGHITWRYWLGAVQDAEVFQDEAASRRAGEARSAPRSRSRSKSKSESGSKSEAEEKTKSRSASIGKAETAGGKKKELPCRISVKVSGVEAFIYNRSPAYDMVIDATMKKSNSRPESGSDSDRVFAGEETASSSSQEDEKDRHQLHFGVAAERTETATTRDTNVRSACEALEIPGWLRMLPVRVECKRAAAAVGNEHTTSVATAKVERACGTIDAGRAGPLDFYKLLFNFELEKCVAQLKPNRDFKQKQMDAARRILREQESKDQERRLLRSRAVRMITHTWRNWTDTFYRQRSTTGSVRAASMKSIANESVAGNQDQIPGESQWHGLSRYLDDSEPDEHREWQGVEYAKSSTLVDCDKVGFRFYFDIPGQVQNGVTDSDTLLRSAFNEEDINGALPPEYGMEFFVHGGSIVYGPWADRERINLQHVFFPPSYVDAVPAKRLKVGDTRAWTVFKIYVSIEEDVVLRIPTRESSKDDQWQGRAEKSQLRPPEEEDMKYGKRRRHHKRRRKAKQGKSGIDMRPFGWLDVTVKKDTTVNYIMDMFARSTGYRNSLDLDVKGTEMMTSVNHGLLWRAGHLTLDADLSYPIGWNKLKKWPFNVVCNDLELFILRDHFFLIIDIVNDWSSGPPPEFYTFVPYFYGLNLEFRNWCMYLNVNDANIINDPADLDKNDFLTLEGKNLIGKLSIPMELYRPVRNEITWDVVSTDMHMRMLSPSRNTMYTLLKDKQVASLPKMTMTGGIDQHSDSKPGQTDLLRFDIWACGLELKAFGQLIRQFISLKEDYFGDYIHFKTLEEFQHASEDLEEANAKTASLPRAETPNEMDVILCIVVEDTSVKLPTNLYSCNDWIQAELPLANLDLRINSYYLDMGLNLSPLSFLTGSSTEEKDESNTQIYLSHCDLYGHRTFGLPPTEPAYLSQWDIDIGTLTGECSGCFLHDLALAGRAFAFAFQDKENVLPVTSPNIFNDATFVRVRTDIIRLWLHVGKDALMFKTQPISVDTNDLAGDRISQRINVTAPLVTLCCVDGRSASRHRMPEGRRYPVRTYAFLQTGATVDVLIRKANFEKERAMQQAHLRRSDQRTGRTPFLLRSKDLLTYEASDANEVKPPFLPVPPIPFPLKRPGQFNRRPPSIRSIPSLYSGKSLATKNSSASIRTSMNESRLSHPRAAPELTRKRSGGQSSMSSAGSGSSVSLPPRRTVLPDDRERARFGLAPSTMAFSSPFAEPYFPLDLVEPDEANVPQFTSVPEMDDGNSENWSISDVIGDPDMDQSVDKESDHTAVFIKLSPGIRGYLEPRVGIIAAKLIKKLLPKSPEDVMDSFQIDVMAGVTSHMNARECNPSVLEISASLPSAQLRVVHPHGKSSDQVDISIHALEQMVRKKEWSSQKGAHQALALHSVVKRLEVALNERRGSDLTPAVTTRIEEILVWVSLAGNNSIHTTVRDTQLMVSDLQANYFAQMALQLVPLVDDLKMRFHTVFETPRKKLLCLIYTLTQQGEGVPDPPFLSRMTYILRAFHGHFRNQESWKVLARFRQMLDYIPENSRIDLSARFKASQFECPADAPTKVMESWGQWRNWDIPNVNDTLAFRILFSQAEHRPMEEPDDQPLMLTIRSEMMKLTIGNDTVASQMLVKEMSLGVDSTPPIKPTGLMLMEENKRRKTLIQLHTSLIDFSFNWTALDVVKAILPMIEDFKNVTEATDGSESRGPSGIINDELERHEFHVVVSTDSGSIALQSINLRHVSRAERMKMSLIGTRQASDQYGKCASAIVNADRATTELHGPSHCIWKTLLTSPSLYLDHLHPAVIGQIAPSATVAIAYNDLNIAVTEQLPGILHIVDSVILDEVAEVMEIVKLATGESSATKDEQNESCKVQSPSLDVQFNVAVLAGHLHIEVALLQSLSYRLDGIAASIRVTPHMSSTKGASIDFDMGRQSHGFLNLSMNESHHQSILTLPPINGHVAFEVSTEVSSISVAASIEKIEIEASAMQGIAGVVSKPEVQEVFKSVQNSIEEMKLHIVELDLGLPKRKTSTVDGYRTTLFDVRFALLGIRVSAGSSEIKDRARAGLEFGIGPLHATASNRDTVSDDNQLIPEVRAQIQDIGARLWVDSQGKHDVRGDISFGIKLHFNIYADKNGSIARDLTIQSNALEVNAYPETASTMIDVINHLQDKLRDLDLSREVEYLRRLRDARKSTVIRTLKSKPFTAVIAEQEQEAGFSATDLLSVRTVISLTNIRACWHVDRRFNTMHDGRPDDIVLTLSSIEFTTHSGHEARLSIKDTLLQLTEMPCSLTERSLNSALLPDMSFGVGFWTQDKNRSVAFKATGKPLDVRLESRFIVPVKALQNSIEFAIERVKEETATWKSAPTSSGAPRQPLFDTKRLAALVIEADFAGARVYLQSSGEKRKTLGALAVASQEHRTRHGRYGQFAAEGELMHTSLTAPGIALKVEYNNQHSGQPTLNGELRVDASTNMLLPNVVPLLLEVSNSVKEVMQTENTPINAKSSASPDPESQMKSSQKFFEDDSIVTADPSNVFGKTKVDLGLRICRQEFGLSCQPIARIDAKATLDDFYFTMNTIASDEYGHFFAMSAVISSLSAQVKHVYSREPTFSYETESIVISLMNSKHLSGVNGISAILKVNPTKLSVNAKQFQDLLLFREIWLPPEIRDASSIPPDVPSTRPDEYLVQRYQLAAAAAAFPWNATVSIAKLAIDMDLGQSLGKTSFAITNLWASQEKSSSFEQNLCIGLGEVAMDSVGRMGGFINLSDVGVRTSIRWPNDTKIEGRTPLIQASAGFGKLRAKAAFDYQSFAFGDVEGFDFLMYNVWENRLDAKENDRLVAVLDCDKAYVFCTSTSTAQSLGLYQAFDRLIQEKQTAYIQSLRDIEKHARRESTVVPTRFGPQFPGSPVKTKPNKESPISLHTDVVLTLGTISFGVYPSTFFDSQLLKLDANTIQARFAVGFEHGKIHSGLGMTMGQLQVALAAVRRMTAVPKALEVSVDEVMNIATQAKGGVIVRVPKVVASMETWQAPSTNDVDYIFKSLFDGKIDVGWNLSRINFIKGMWTAHSRSLASRLGKPLPESAVKITAGPGNEKAGDEKDTQDKITAEVNLPLSKYEYHALETPIIETPQLRDMGEATPPLEWIGLHRDRLPNVTHQIILVSLLEVAKEVEDAYGRILGSS